MTAWRVLAGRAVIIDVGAKRRRVAEERLEFGGDRRIIGAGEGGRGERRRGSSGEKLNDERERDDEGGQTANATPPRQTSPDATRRFLWAAAVHVDLPFRLKENARRTVAHRRAGRNSFVTAAAR